MWRPSAGTSSDNGVVRLSSEGIPATPQLGSLKKAQTQVFFRTLATPEFAEELHVFNISCELSPKTLLPSINVYCFLGF